MGSGGSGGSRREVGARGREEFNRFVSYLLFPTSLISYLCLLVFF
jgi:hypothetical protein